MRLQAVRLLGQIGSAKYCSPLVALLWDDDSAIARAAAESLSAIGGDREVVALKIWLDLTQEKGNGQVRSFVQKRLADLEARLRLTGKPAPH